MSARSRALLQLAEHMQWLAEDDRRWETFDDTRYLMSERWDRAAELAWRTAREQTWRSRIGWAWTEWAGRVDHRLGVWIERATDWWARTALTSRSPRTSKSSEPAAPAWWDAAAPVGVVAESAGVYAADGRSVEPSPFTDAQLEQLQTLLAELLRDVPPPPPAPKVFIAPIGTEPGAGEWHEIGTLNGPVRFTYSDEPESFWDAERAAISTATATSVEVELDLDAARGLLVEAAAAAAERAPTGPRHIFRGIDGNVGAYRGLIWTALCGELALVPDDATGSVLIGQIIDRDRLVCPACARVRDELAVSAGPLRGCFQ